MPQLPIYAQMRCQPPGGAGGGQPPNMMQAPQPPQRPLQGPPPVHMGQMHPGLSHMAPPRVPPHAPPHAPPLGMPGSSMPGGPQPPHMPHPAGMMPHMGTPSQPAMQPMQMQMQPPMGMMGMHRPGAPLGAAAQGMGSYTGPMRHDSRGDHRHAPYGGRGGGQGGRDKGGGRWGGQRSGRFDRAKNDYAQHFVDTGLRPANFIRDSDVAERFEEYPKLKELMELKDARISERATPSTYKRVDLRNFDLSTLGTKFDVVLIDPPWEEYRRRKLAAGGLLESDETEARSCTFAERVHALVDGCLDAPARADSLRHTHTHVHACTEALVCCSCGGEDVPSSAGCGQRGGGRKGQEANVDSQKI
eukprot:6212270-Pleurochrysis_carterae.AAC.4